MRSFYPLADHYGLAPTQVAVAAIDVHNSASSWSKALLDNAAPPLGAIVYGGVDGQVQMSVDQYDRLIHEMETHHQGAHNAGWPMLLEGADRNPMGFSPSDMEFQKSKEAAAREIGCRRLMVRPACLSCKWRSSLKVLALACFETSFHYLTFQECCVGRAASAR